MKFKKNRRNKVKFSLKNILISASVFLIAGGIPGLSFGQSTELLKAKMMGQSQSQSSASPNINVRGLGDDTQSIWGGNLMPDEVPLDIPEQSVILVDKTINPEEYIVGPGDLIGIYFWGQIDKNYEIRVSPDGYLMIPTLGSINVAGKTLAEASSSVKQAAALKYKNLDTTVFLMQPKRFRLFVTGLVYNPGMHVSNASERLSDVLERAGLIIPEEFLNAETRIKSTEEASASSQEGINATGRVVEPDKQSKMTSQKNYTLGRSYYVGSLGQTGRTRLESIMGNNGLLTMGENRGSSIRSIIIERNGKKIEADILKFLKFGDIDSNPRLNSGDNIIVSAYKGDISVYGEVNDPGTYEFKDGDRICDLIGFAGGINGVADLSHAMIARFSDDGKTFDSMEIDLDDALNKNPADVKYNLKESDRLYIYKKPEYKEKNDVVVYGEVKYPGSYPIIGNVTKLSDVLKLTGGFTGKENLNMARLLRKKDFVLNDLEYERLKKLLVNERIVEENQYVVSIEKNFAGSVNIDFKKLIIENDKKYDVTLEDGDIIFIPYLKNTVNVIGAVKHPATIILEKDVNLKYYVDKAGGLNWDADKRRMWLIKNRTSQRFKASLKTDNIESGDTIQITAKARRTVVSYLREYVGYVSVASTVILLLRN
jgi:protein involved in polysaccharide export with SLBB domain